MDEINVKKNVNEKKELVSNPEVSHPSLTGRRHLWSIIEAVMPPLGCQRGHCFMDGHDRAVMSPTHHVMYCHVTTLALLNTSLCLVTAVTCCNRVLITYCYVCQGGGQAAQWQVDSVSLRRLPSTPIPVSFPLLLLPSSLAPRLVSLPSTCSSKRQGVASLNAQTFTFLLTRTIIHTFILM